MNAIRAQRWVGLLLAMAAITSYCLADGNLVLFLLAVPGAVVGWVFTMAPRGRPLPRIVINLILLVILGYTLVSMTARGFSVSTVCEVITFILMAKILDRRSQRDFGQVVSISAFLLVGTILTSNGLGVGVLLVMSLLLLAGATILHQIARHVEISAGVMPARVPMGRHYRRDVRRLVFCSTVVGLLISIGVFLVVPRRLGAGLFGEWGNAAVGQVTGFADEVELGTPGLISQSAVPVLDLQVFNDRGVSLGGTGVVHYLRGAVLDSYENGRWLRSRESGDRGFRQRTDHLLSPMLLADEPRRWNIEQRVTVRNAGASRSHLFASWRPVRLTAHQPTFIHTAPDGTILRESESGKFEYTVYSIDRESPTRYVGRQTWGEITPLDSPSLDMSRFAELASEILGRAEVPVDPGEREIEDFERGAVAIEQYFLDGFFYTLEAEVVPRRQDPTEWFLFTHRAGHCEYFASAMAVLCRSVGINARVITGFVATEYNEATGHYLVRQSNAHAWVEVEIGPGVWRTFDPTPPSDFQRVHEVSQSWLARAQRMFDAVEFAWIRAVVSFDAEKQTSFVRSAFGFEWSPDRQFDQFAERLRRKDPREVAGLAIVFMMMVAGATLLLVMLVRSRHALARLVRDLWLSLSWSSVDATAGLNARFLRELRRRGAAKPAHVPLLTHVIEKREVWSLEGGREAEAIAVLLYSLKFRESQNSVIREVSVRLKRLRKM